MRIRMKVKELKDASVDYISLVPRSANRVPFRVLKHQENEMIDLATVGMARVLKGAAEAVKKSDPHISGVVVLPKDDAHLAELAAVVKAEGFDTEKAIKNDDGTVIFAQEDKPLEDATTVRMSEHMLLVVKGFSEYADELSKSGSFSDVVAARGFYQNLGVATEAFRSLAYKAMYDATDPSDAAVNIRKAADQLAGYAETLARGLPVKAFKLDKSITELEVQRAENADKSKEKEPEGKEPEAKDKPKAKEPDANGKEPAAKDEKVEKSEKTDPPATPSVADIVREAVTAIKGEIGSLIEQAVAPIRDDVKKSSEKVDAVSQKVEDAQKVIKATVVGTANDEKAPVLKGEDGKPYTLLGDTGMADIGRF